MQSLSTLLPSYEVHTHHLLVSILLLSSPRVLRWQAANMQILQSGCLSIRLPHPLAHQGQEHGGYGYTDENHQSRAKNVGNVLPAGRDW
jgi:hypothetical protein